MAVISATSGMRVAGLHYFRLCSAQAKSLSTFYESALGFRQVAVEHVSGARTLERFGMGGRSLRITLQLGAQTIKLLQFVDHPGNPYPANSDSSDRIFQHFALVVANMDAAMAQLARVPGWTPITQGGPQQLPASSGSVTAFKFRDPEGHPLELLAFPPENTPGYWRHTRAQGPFLGIDHSAISVADSARSVDFYTSLGLDASHRSLNKGEAQARLDHLQQPVVQVIAMTALNDTPHVELLCYQPAEQGSSLNLRANDVAATCLVFTPASDSIRPQARHARNQDFLDPDGHRLAIEWPDA